MIQPLLFFEQEPTQALTTAHILIVPSFLLYLEMNALEGNKILAPANRGTNIHTCINACIHTYVLIAEAVGPIYFSHGRIPSIAKSLVFINEKTNCALQEFEQAPLRCSDVARAPQVLK